MKDTRGRNTRRLPDITCAQCKKVFRPRRASTKFCSRHCQATYIAARRPHKSENWLSKPDNQGYIRGFVYQNGKKRHLRQHQWIAEQYLGRPIARNEIVHHWNEIKNR
jgi:hypothetical protein